MQHQHHQQQQQAPPPQPPHMESSGQAPGSMGDDEVLTKFEDVSDGFPQHEECVAILTMKCGEPLMAVRKKLHEEIPIVFVPEEGFAVFQSKVERHYCKIGSNYVQEKRAIYLKPSSNATQSKYVQLTKENFDPLLRVRWKVARSMKVELKYEVFCYFVDMTTKKEKKRMSMKMFQHQQQQQLLPESPSADMLAGGIGFAPAAGALPLASALSQAMQGYSDVSPPPVLGEVPTKKGKRGSSGNGDDGERPRKSSRVARAAADVMDAAAQAEAEAQQQQVPTPPQQQPQPVFHMIPFRINGFVVPLEVDVTALRRSLGLLQAPPVNAADAAVAAAAAAAAAAVGDLDGASSTHQYDR